MSVAAAPRSQILANTSESCVGREAEIGQVVEAFDAGRGTFVAVTGRAGIGKSTLLNTLTRRLRAAGGAVLAVRCRAGLASSRALADLGQGLLQHLCEHGSADLIAAAEELVSMIQGRAAPAPEELDPVLQRVALFDHLASLCAAISASRPMALVVHDVDAADITTRQLVSYLARVLTGALELSDEGGRQIDFPRDPLLDQEPEGDLARRKRLLLHRRHPAPGPDLDGGS